MIKDEIKDKANLKKETNLKKIEIKRMRTKSKTNTNWRTQLNLSKHCTYTEVWEREKKGRRKKINRRRTVAQITKHAILKDVLSPSMSR
jgi:hypothetical protein